MWFRDYLLDQGSSKRNITNYLKVFDLFSRHIGSKKNLNNITKKDLLSFLDSKKKTLEDDPDQKWIVTWNDYFSRLNGFFRWDYNKDNDLDRDQWKTHPIFSGIRRKKNKRFSRYNPNEVWSQIELFTVVKYCTSPMVKALLMVMSDIAGRNDELVKLKFKHLVFKEKYAEITIPWDTKTGSRTAPLIASFPYLREWLNIHPFRENPENFIFVSRTTGKSFRPDSLWHITNDLKKKIKKLLAKGEVNPSDRKILEDLMKVEYTIQSQTFLFS